LLFSPLSGMLGVFVYKHHDGPIMIIKENSGHLFSLRKSNIYIAVQRCTWE